MTDPELFKIVKGHREEWPRDVIQGQWPNGELNFNVWGAPFPYAEYAMEASFHRALLERGDVYTAFVNPTYHVQIADHDFTGGSLIEAYAAALEWLK